MENKGITREELMQIRTLHQGMWRDIQRLKELRERAVCIPSGLGGSSDRVQNSIDNRAGRWSDRAHDLEVELNERDAELEALKKHAEACIRTIDDRIIRDILIYRYVDCREWDTIAQVMGYSLRRCYQLHAEGLSRLEKAA